MLPEIRDDIVTFIASSSAPFYGQFEGKGLRMRTCSPYQTKDMTAPRPGDSDQRSYCEVVALVDPPNKNEIAVVGEHISAPKITVQLMSLFSGKLFLLEGLTNAYGSPMLINPSVNMVRVNKDLTVNSEKPRVDFPVTDSFQCFSILDEMDCRVSEDAFEYYSNYFLAALREYHNGMRLMESYPMSSYLHFVTAIECISGFPIRNESDDIKKSGVTNRFVKCIVDLIFSDGSGFIAQSESISNSSDRRFPTSKTKMINAIKRAYDLRSRMSHGGIDLSRNLDVQRCHLNHEMLHPNICIEDEKLKESLMFSPSVVGMERIVRFCLISSLYKAGIVR